MNEDDIRAIRTHVPELATTPSWLIELAWREYSSDVWAAGCIGLDADRLDSFRHWLQRRSAR